MRLFDWKDYKLIVLPEVFTIKSFKDLADRDKTKNKSQLEKELSFIYFTYDPRSEMQFIVDEKERIERVKELIGLDSKFKIDTQLQKAISSYNLMTKTTSSELLKDIKFAVEKIRKYISSTDSIDEDSFDKYVNTIAKLLPLAEKILDTERRVVKEVEELSEARGSKAQTILDNNFENFIS